MSRQESRLAVFRRLALAGAVLAALVVVLGAWVRLTYAGLGCPDWPACYGHVYPQVHEGFAKALHEMVHRYFASSLGLVVAALLLWALVNRRDSGQPVGLVIVLFIVVAVQGTLGALTVTLKVPPLIVTAHLLGGLSTLAILWWLSLTPDRDTVLPRERGLRSFAVVAFAILVVQVALGGWTSTNYAAVACPDFPTCQNAWWPPADYGEAFAPWHGLGINYEGGVLGAPARVAIHWTHRLGAVVAGSVLIALGISSAWRTQRRKVRFAGVLLCCAVLLQISLGMGTVLLGFPLPLATSHNAGAALLVIAMVTLVRALWPSPAIAMVPLRGVDAAR
jgi:cytochrome c oxidase assembly protein subunit 15